MDKQRVNLEKGVNMKRIDWHTDEQVIKNLAMQRGKGYLLISHNFAVMYVMRFIPLKK